MTRKNDLDDRIRHALRAEDADLIDEFGDEPPLTEAVLETFRGRRRWMTYYVVFWSFAFLGLTIFCGFRFFDAETTRAMIGWATGFTCCLMVTMMIKVWFWGQLDKNAVTREVKRVELQLARLSARLGPGE